MRQQQPGMQILAQPDAHSRQCPKCRAALPHGSIDRYQPNVELMDLIDLLQQQQLQPAQPTSTQPAAMQLPPGNAATDVTAAFRVDSEQIARGDFLNRGAQGCVFEVAS